MDLDAPNLVETHDDIQLAQGVEPVSEMPEKEAYAYGGAIIPGPKLTEDNADDFARRLIAWSFATAPLFQRADGGAVNDPAQTAVDTARQINPMGFYSAAAEAASKFPQRAPIDQIINKIKGQPNVKKEELDNANLADAFAGQKSVDPKEVARHLQKSLPQISEKIYGGKPAVQYKPKALLERPKGFENTDDVYEVGPQGKPPHLIAVNGDNFDVWGPSGYHNSFDSFNDAVEYANQSIHGVEPTEYSQYTIPGGENYREVVLTLPNTSEAQKLREEAEKRGYGSKISQWPDQEFAQRYRDVVTNAPQETGLYKSSHWSGVDNPIAHIRMSDRDNGKTLHLEELQSDWGQTGRDEGFYDPNRPEEKSILGQMSRDVSSAVPKAPYVTSTDQWVDLGLKRALIEAAKGGYDKLIWTPGEEQANRYKLSKHVQALAYDPEEKTLSYLPHTDPNYRGYIDIPGNVEPHEIKKHIGKEAAKRLLETEPHKLSGNHILEGLDLEVGKEGMQDFYDKLVPQRLSKLVSQYDKDAKIQLNSHKITIPGETGQKLTALRITDPTNSSGYEDKDVMTHSIQITPKLREAILKGGLPAFEKGGSVIDAALDVVSKLRR